MGKQKLKNRNPTFEDDDLQDRMRLKSKRRQQRQHGEKRDKQLMKLFREKRSIDWKISSLGYMDVEIPVQSGWKRYYVLRQDVARSKLAGLLQDILNKIDRVEYSWSPRFPVWGYSSGSFTCWRDVPLGELTVTEFRMMSFSKRQAKEFYRARATNAKGESYLYLRGLWRFVRKVKPNMIMRTKIKDPDLELRRDEIKRYLERNGLWPKVLKLMGGSYQWRNRRSYEGDLARYAYDPFKNRSFADILTEYYPEKKCSLEKSEPSTFEGSLFAVWVTWKS